MSNKKKLIIFGSGPCAEVVIQIVEEHKLFDIKYVTIDKKYRQRNYLHNYKITNYENIKKIKNKKDYLIFVALGYSNMNKDRETICKRVKKDGFTLANIIHPKSNISKSVRIGKNCFVMQDVHIHPFVQIGNNNFIWSGTILCHHVKVGNNCWFTSGSSIAGMSKIGNNCFLGINSTLINNLTIKNEVFIGARALVSRNTNSKKVIISKGEDQLALDSSKFLQLINNKF
jgi:sugar O-acyltransferase (sialic acid O-acetyltransferase NeuD family)